MKEYDQSTLFVDFGQLMEHDKYLAEAVATEFYRCVCAVCVLLLRISVHFLRVPQV